MNYQPTKELQYFQRMILGQKFNKVLNLWIDELEWENEKKETIIEMKDAEILALGDEIKKLKLENIKVNNEFRQYVKSHKDFKRDKEKEAAQQALINELKGKVTSISARLETRDRMVKLLEKQNRGTATLNNKR